MQTELLPLTAKPVPEAKRLAFLPRHWPKRYMEVETACFNLARSVLPFYHGAYWEFVELTNGGGYLWPHLDADHPSGKLQVQWAGNGYRGLLSAEALGIVITLMACSHLSFKYEEDQSLAEQFHLLREYIHEHPEAAEIFRAID